MKSFLQILIAAGGILIYPPIAVSRDASLTIGEYIQGRLYFTIAANLAVFGTIAFGFSVWRTRSYPRWIAIALMICPAVLLQSIALIVMGRDGLRRHPHGIGFATGRAAGGVR